MLAVLELVRAALKVRGTSASWNLHLDKLSFERDSDGGAKKQSLDSVLRSYAAAGTQTHLADACKRQRTFRGLLRSQLGANYREVTLINTTRLLLHLGRTSVQENVGLASERTTGLPVIPGSGVKGIVSTWACWEANLQADGALPETIAKPNQDRTRFSSTAEHILGSNAETGSEAAGEVVFLGGFPITPPKLVLDILTPHAGGNPLPNPFLALDPGTRWIFPLLARARQGDAGTLLQQAEAWLIEALTQVGLGAKTAAGYGRFRPLTTAEVQRLETERLAGIAAEVVKQKAIEQERKRLTEAVAKQKAAEALDKQKADELALLSPDERAYVEYVRGVTDWTAPAREIAIKSHAEKHWILRYFRTDNGQTEIARWPRNDKASKRLQNLKDAGL